MKHILITPTGSVMTFHVLAVAELYKTIKGGVLITGVITADTVEAQNV